MRILFRAWATYTPDKKFKEFSAISGPYPNRDAARLAQLQIPAECRVQVRRGERGGSWLLSFEVHGHWFRTASLAELRVARFWLQLFVDSVDIEWSSLPQNGYQTLEEALRDALYELEE